MRLTMEDQKDVTAFQKLFKTEEGRCAFRFIDRLLLRDECAYLPGNRHGQTEFRCGMQKAGMLLHDYAEKEIDWKKIEERERSKT